MNARTLEGQHALVTGAGSGIGEAIAIALALAGARVSLAGRRRDPLLRVAEQCEGRGQVIDRFDVVSEEAVEKGLAAANRTFGPLRILVNNAGEAPSAPFEKTSAEMWAHTIGIDLTGVFNVTRLALPQLRERPEGARVINVASTAGLKGYRYVTAYCAAKHGVIGLTRALALELARTGVTVNAVCPGFTDTPMIQASVDAIVAKTGRSRDEAVAELAKTNPQGRLVHPQEVADAVLWLTSPAASAVTGQSIVVAGGEVM